MILMLKVFLRLVDSFEIIFRQETLSITTAEVTEVNFKRLFVYFLSADIFCPEPTINLMFYLFISKAQNEQGILLFVHWKLA